MATYLDHGLLPQQKPAVPLRNVDTKVKALNYAGGGFHTSVTRGLSSSGYTQGLWDKAAGAYLGVAQSIAGISLEQAVSMLGVANTLADAAYKSGGGGAPRDPATGTTEPALDPAGGGGGGGSPLAKLNFQGFTMPIVAGLGLLWLWKESSKKGGKRKRRSTRRRVTTRRRSSGGRRRRR